MATSPKPAVCSEQRRLSELYLQAVQEIMQLEQAEIEAVMSSSGGLDRFHLALEVARKKRDEAKLAYMLHIQGHGC